jgi:hypothetical protein
MAEMVGKIVNVSSKGFKDLKKPVPARNYTAVVIAYAPVLPYLVPSNIVSTVKKMVLSLDKPGDSHTYGFKFDSETVPVNIGRYVEYPAPFFTKKAEPGVMFDTFEWPFAAPYMSRVDVELSLIGDEVAVRNVSNTNKIYYKKYGVKDANFVEIVKNEVVYVQSCDRVFLCDVNRIPKDKHVDYSFTVRASNVTVRNYVVPMSRIANYALDHYLVKKDGTSQDVPGGVAAYVKGVHAMLKRKGSWTAGPDGFSLDGFMVVPRAAITETGGTPSLKRKVPE